METVTLTIAGMACGGCAANLQQALLALEGVASAEVSHATALALVRYEPSRVSPAAIHAAIVAAGYSVA